MSSPSQSIQQRTYIFYLMLGTGLAGLAPKRRDRCTTAAGNAAARVRCCAGPLLCGSATVWVRCCAGPLLCGSAAVRVRCCAGPLLCGSAAVRVRCGCCAGPLLLFRLWRRCRSCYYFCCRLWLCYRCCYCFSCCAVLRLVVPRSRACLDLVSCSVRVPYSLNAFLR